MSPAGSSDITASSRRSGARTFGDTVGVAVSLGGVACGMTLLFLGMRAVMDVGGFCAEGGPYVIQRHCPVGVVPVLFASVWGGVIFVGLYAWRVRRAGAPSLLMLLWPALFLSLGWNFLEYGLHPPQGPGLAWGWLISGSLFVLMGAVPAVFFMPGVVRAFLTPRAPVAAQSQRTASPGPGPIPTMSTTPAWPSPSALPAWFSAGVAPSAPVPAGGSQGDVVAELERLDALHRRGAIDDAEYARAKATVLEPKGRP